jgi:hypothetical protein
MCCGFNLAVRDDDEDVQHSFGQLGPNAAGRLGKAEKLKAAEQDADNA